MNRRRVNLNIARVGRYNPHKQQRGYSARVITSGKAGYDEIVDTACSHTTLHKAEAKVALELCMETVATLLKEGTIVDLGPIGRFYPSCSSGWREHPDELQLSGVKPDLCFRPAADLRRAIRSASLQWAKKEAAEAEKA
ncbi:MAG: hypothetical protein IJV22_00010 [Bacteroidales bacterium]|nr:hypothetical protein [Bacteroidales bacterium]